jgi:hypothetical protein
MEKKFEKAMAQLISRAAILMQIGASHYIYATMHPSVEHFTFILDELEVKFDKENPFDNEKIIAVLEELDKMIFDWKKEAAAGISLIEAWGA